MDINIVTKKISPILHKYNIVYAGVFGSVARQEDRVDSDIDLLISFKKMPGLVQFIRLENELTSVLNRNVDLVVKGSEKALIKENIQKDLIPLYNE